MRRRLDRTIRLLIVLNIVAVASLLAVVVYSAATGSNRPGTPAQLMTPGPSGSDDLMDMGIAHIPTTASCLLCHEGGGEGAIKVVPALGHPVEGWARCLICHTNDSLAKAAPGHEGIPETECLNCHKTAPEGPPITQAHSQLQTPCLDCHGTFAHLPTSMVGRDQDECWLCHKPAPEPPPRRPHPVVEGVGCRTCHQASDVGALPMDHAFRGDDTCVLCHVMSPGASPSPSTGLTPPLVPLGRPGG